jgi:hypothetical protein
MKNTLEELFYAISILAVIVGGILWLAAIDSKATATAKELDSISTTVERSQAQFEEIRIRLTHIEDALAPKSRKF